MITKIESAIVRSKLSRRGGGIEISLDDYGFEGQLMSAYCNYLGGGLLGSIQTNDTIRRESLRSTVSDADNAKLDEIALELRDTLCGLLGIDSEDNARLIVSAY